VRIGVATGTLASLGADGLKVQAALMEELKLGQPEIAWHTQRDRFAEAGRYAHRAPAPSRRAAPLPWPRVPVCPPPGTITVQGKNTWICNGATWYWAYNDPNLSDPGADQNVQAQYIFAPGTTGPVGNRPGLQYVTNSPSDPLFNGSADPWYDSNIQQGVLQQMK
jgi:hypothetical protein